VDKPEQGWDGNVGVVTKLLEKSAFEAEKAIAFVCGPPVMIKFAVRTLSSLGLSPGNIFVSLESRMRCGIGKCGHCHFGGKLVCTDGPVFSLEEVMELPRELAPF
jgi:NAD(P)H-flavin reductase